MNGGELTAYDVAQIRAAVVLVYVAGAVMIAAWFLAMRDAQGVRRWTRLKNRYFPVKPFPNTYGKHQTDDVSAPQRISYPASDVDADADADATTGMVILPENVLQERLTEAYDRGAAEAFGALLGAGFLAQSVEAKKLTTMKHLLFGASGTKLNRLKPIIDAAAAKHRPAVAAEAQRTPIADRPTTARFQE